LEAELRPSSGGHGIDVERDDPDVINEIGFEGFVLEFVWDGDGDEIGPRTHEICVWWYSPNDRRT
jgi:hypothetical protein